MKKTLLLILVPLMSLSFQNKQEPPLLPENIVEALAGELSGIVAKRNLEYLTRYHRMRGSRGFREAAEHIAAQLRQYGLQEVRIEEIPADGKTFYGPQKARPAWDADFAELWELQQEDGLWKRYRRLASWEAMPITLAQDSESAELTAELVDVGRGTQESDYLEKNVKGKIVLTSAQPGAVSRLAVEEYGALGIISYAQNQHTAWWKEDENLVRWGHLDSFSETATFAFMISLKQARSFQQRLARGETIRLEAKVQAGKHEGFYNVVTAIIPGADPILRNEEIAFSCHLDHQLPGANDNASGSVTILEVARTLARLIDEGRIARPARTLRFIWPPEIEGTHALLNFRPELASRIKAVIHMDMVGGNEATKAVFHVTRGPASLPSIVNDVAEAFGGFVNSQSGAFAAGEATPYPLVSPEGGKEPLQAEMVGFTQGSDHQVYTDGSYGIPAIYLNDWPDRYIHTNFDTPANIDPTKLKRAAFIGAASGYFLADLHSEQVPALWQWFQSQCLRRTAGMLERKQGRPIEETDNILRFHYWYESGIFKSIGQFATIPEGIEKEAAAFFSGLKQLSSDGGNLPPPQGDGKLVFSRNPQIKGPLSTFGYNYLEDHLGREATQSLGLLQYQGLRGSGGDYAYEVLNFTDGKRTARDIRNAVSAIYGPVPLELVVEYLQALQRAGVVK